MRIGETGDVLEVPARGDVIEIPWDRIRSVADPDFRAHLCDRAAERAQRIGRAIRAMRLEVGLPRAELAARIGVTERLSPTWRQASWSPDSTLIESIAKVLGRGLRDFAEECS